MALILNKTMSGKKCWACGQDINENQAAVLITGFRDLVYMHMGCATSISQQLLRDISQAVDLGYDDEDE